MKHANATIEHAVAVIARCGYAAKGIVYLIIGVLASMAAFGLGGKNIGTKEAITQIAGQPFGSTMLGLMAFGLFAYTLWRVIQAFFDTEDAGSGFKGIATRLGFVISGVIYAGLGVYCIDLLLNVGASSGDGESTQDRTARLMSNPGGIYLVFAVGVIFIGVGIRQIVRAVKRSYLKNWHMIDMNQTQRKLAEGATRWGLSARGVVFMIIGGFLCIAAWQTDPSEAQGLGGALNTLARQPFGPWLLGIVALGLVGYGIYCFVNARFRDVSTD
ncbi:protein of unknown function [Modicisalibacter ilicicola DSM 19980]|uniref:DUF1206 domain-containing protein n=1 Tax=Modicisalibacter ilicicola DSM 19980 TaxID=1121942 RepID=A0A1M5BWE3_9GAMM|nr:DUF1206 domain-containing protein [Halomonas ilicicola]SHF46923.1 protein of unknown function [Halomonas ilicicola DSM 19980]